MKLYLFLVILQKNWSLFAFFIFEDFASFILLIARLYISDLATLFVQLVENQQVGVKKVLNFKNITKINAELATVRIHDLDPIL